jgi:aminoglycoside phosphotransferase (APT) family kinase protein
LKPFTPSADCIARAGRLLGDLHATTSGIQDGQLRQYADVRDLITDKIALIARFDTPLSERVRKIRDQLFARGHQTIPDPRVCLLRGDMGWRNLHLDSRDQMWLLDFEHAALGHPLLDFAKLWDRELHTAHSLTASISSCRMGRAWLCSNRSRMT